MNFNCLESYEELPDSLLLLEYSTDIQTFAGKKQSLEENPTALSQRAGVFLGLPPSVCGFRQSMSECSALDPRPKPLDSGMWSHWLMQ